MLSFLKKSLSGEKEPEQVNSSIIVNQAEKRLAWI